MRNINEEIFADEFFGSLTKLQRLLWLGLITTIADDQGRMVDNVALIRSQIFPYDDDVTIKDIDKTLTLFAQKHKITRYMHGTNGSGKRLMQIVNWWKYQKSTQWAKRSQYPAPAKWSDRVRVHESGGGIALVNWDHPGGYLRSRYEAPAKKQRRRNEGDKREDEVKELKESYSLKRALEIFKANHITVKATDQTVLEEMTPHIKEDWIQRAVKIALESNKHSAAYVIGILKNWRSENANTPKRNKQSTDKPAPGTGQTTNNAATRAAAKRIAEQRRASNV